AIGDMDAGDWARPAERKRLDRSSPWETADDIIGRAGIAAEQVQVLWILQAHRRPERFGVFPGSLDALARDLEIQLASAVERWPNLLQPRLRGVRDHADEPGAPCVRNRVRRPESRFGARG